MATYAELYDLRNDSVLRNKITAATAIQADVIRAENGATVNHANRLIWAKRAFTNAGGVADELLWAVLAGNRTSTVAQIQGASDANILTAVAAVVDVFATGS